MRLLVAEDDARLLKSLTHIFESNNYVVDGVTNGLDRLFDRFYRSDKARVAGSGFGIGLSIARAVTEKMRGEISAYKKDDSHIGFKVVFK